MPPGKGSGLRTDTHFGAAVLYLASNGACYITGTTLDVIGGRAMR